MANGPGNKVMRRTGTRRFVLMMSILLIGAATLPAETDEPGPFQRLFRALRHGVNEPRHKSTTHRSSHQDQAAATATPSNETSNTAAKSETTTKPPSDRNTRSAQRAARLREKG